MLPVSTPCGAGLPVGSRLLNRRIRNQVQSLAAIPSAARACGTGESEADYPSSTEATTTAVWLLKASTGSAGLVDDSVATIDESSLDHVVTHRVRQRSR